MGWKDWPYWLKGGIIGFLIPTILAILFTSIEPIFNLLPNFFLKIALSILLVPIFLIAQTIWLLLALPFGARDFCNSSLAGYHAGSCSIDFSMFILVSVTYLIIGALIGWIVGKINEKKK